MIDSFPKKIDIILEELAKSLEKRLGKDTHITPGLVKKMTLREYKEQHGRTGWGELIDEMRTGDNLEIRKQGREGGTDENDDFSLAVLLSQDDKEWKVQYSTHKIDTVAKNGNNIRLRNTLPNVTWFEEGLRYIYNAAFSQEFRREVQYSLQAPVVKPDATVCVERPRMTLRKWVDRKYKCMIFKAREESDVDLTKYTPELTPGLAYIFGTDTLQAVDHLNHKRISGWEEQYKEISNQAHRALAKAILNEKFVDSLKYIPDGYLDSRTKFEDPTQMDRSLIAEILTSMHKNLTKDEQMNFVVESLKKTYEIHYMTSQSYGKSWGGMNCHQDISPTNHDGHILHPSLDNGARYHSFTIINLLSDPEDYNGGVFETYKGSDGDGAHGSELFRGDDVIRTRNYNPYTRMRHEDIGFGDTVIFHAFLIHRLTYPIIYKQGAAPRTVMVCEFRAREEVHAKYWEKYRKRTEKS